MIIRIHHFSASALLAIIAVSLVTSAVDSSIPKNSQIEKPDENLKCADGKTYCDKYPTQYIENVIKNWITNDFSPSRVNEPSQEDVKKIEIVFRTKPEEKIAKLEENLKCADGKTYCDKYPTQYIENVIKNWITNDFHPSQVKQQSHEDIEKFETVLKTRSKDDIEKVEEYRKCANGKTYCENSDDDDYPKEYIENLLRNSGDSFKEFFKTDEDAKIGSRMDGDPPSNICRSLQERIQPTKSLNRDNNWVYVVNVEPNYRQSIRTETCDPPGESCDKAMGLKFPAQINTICEQKFAQIPLLSVNGTGSPIVIDWFKFPSCCSCKFTESV